MLFLFSFFSIPKKSCPKHSHGHKRVILMSVSIFKLGLKIYQENEKNLLEGNFWNVWFVEKKKVSPTTHNTCIMTVSFPHAGNVNNIRIGAKTQGRICKKIIFSSLMMYTLPNYDGKDAICERLLAQNCLYSSHVCHGSHKSCGSKDRKWKYSQIWRLTFSASPSLLSCGSDAIRGWHRLLTLFPS